MVDVFPFSTGGIHSPHPAPQHCTAVGCVCRCKEAPPHHCGKQGTGAASQDTEQLISLRREVEDIRQPVLKKCP